MSVLRIRAPWLALALAGCASLPHAGPEVLPWAHQRYPEATVTSLEQGRAAYVRRCSGCHALVLPSKLAPEEWPRLVAKMEREQQVRLESAEALLIEQYLVTLSSAAGPPAPAPTP